MKTRADGRAPLLTLVVALHLLCAALWSLAVPPFETPDEPGHARYVDFLLERGRLPAAGEAPGESHQPPLYYALAAAAAGAAGLGPIEVRPVRNPSFRWYGGPGDAKYLHDPGELPPLSGSARALHRLRLLSVVLSGVTVALVYLLASRLLDTPAAAAAAASMAAFLPQFTFISGSLNNDNLANLLAAAALACLTTAMIGPSRAPIWFASGLLAGAGLLAKFSGIALIPCGLLAAFLSRHEEGPAPWRRALAFLAPALAVPLPLLVRNLLELGDPLGASTQVETLPQLLDRKTLLSAYFVTEFPAVLFRSFCGTFGWMSLRMPAPVYAGFAALALAAAAGLALIRWGPRAGRLRLLFLGAIALQLAQIVVYNLTFTQAQGRFLFPVLGPIAALAAAGVGEVTRRVGLRPAWQGWAWLLACGLAACNLGILRFIVVPAYHPGASPP